MNKLIEKIANEKIVEGIINNIAKDTSDEDLKDLANDIYLELLEKNEDCLLAIYDRGQIQYYLTRIVLNNINSKTSRFYYIYKKNKSVTTPIEDANTEKGERADYD
jgi:hypothetical protein